MYTQGVVAEPLAKHSNESARPVVFVGGRVCVTPTTRGCYGWDYGAVAVLSPARDVDGVAVECVGAIGEGQRGGAVRCQRVRLCVGLVMGDHWHGV